MFWHVVGERADEGEIGVRGDGMADVGVSSERDGRVGALAVDVAVEMERESLGRAAREVDASILSACLD